jgi:hypothetical protein
MLGWKVLLVFGSMFELSWVLISYGPVACFYTKNYFQFHLDVHILYPEILWLWLASQCISARPFFAFKNILCTRNEFRNSMPCKEFKWFDYFCYKTKKPRHIRYQQAPLVSTMPHRQCLCLLDIIGVICVIRSYFTLKGVCSPFVAVHRSIIWFDIRQNLMRWILMWMTRIFDVLINQCLLDAWILDKLIQLSYFPAPLFLFHSASDSDPASNSKHIRCPDKYDGFCYNICILFVYGTMHM